MEIIKEKTSIGRLKKMAGQMSSRIGGEVLRAISAIISSGITNTVQQRTSGKAIFMLSTGPQEETPDK